jgi:hypothetical protein
MIEWLKRLIYGTSKVAEVPESVGRPEVDNQVGKKVVRNRRAVPAGKSDKSTKPTRVRSDNKSQTSRKRTGAAVRVAAVKGKTKSKAVPKG